MGVVDGRTLAATGTAAAAAVLIMPHGCHLPLSVPILTDEAGLAVGLVWILLFTSRSTAVVSTASLPAALLAVCTREVWAILIAAMALVAFAIREKRLLASAGTAVVAVAAYMFVTHVPAFGRYSESNRIHHYWNLRFSSPAEFSNMVWGVVFAVGLIPLVLVSRSAVRWLHHEVMVDHELRRDDDGGGPRCSCCVTAPFVGNDVTRLAFPGGVLLVAAGAPMGRSQPAHADLGSAPRAREHLHLGSDRTADRDAARVRPLLLSVVENGDGPLGRRSRVCDLAGDFAEFAWSLWVRYRSLGASGARAILSAQIARLNDRDRAADLGGSMLQPGRPGSAVPGWSLESMTRPEMFR